MSKASKLWLKRWSHAKAEKRVCFDPPNSFQFHQKNYITLSKHVYTRYICNNHEVTTFSTSLFSLRVLYGCPIWICLQYQFTSWKNQDLLNSKVRNKLFYIDWLLLFLLSFSLSALASIIFSAVSGAVMVLGNRKRWPKRNVQNWSAAGNISESSEI